MPLESRECPGRTVRTQSRHTVTLNTTELTVTHGRQIDNVPSMGAAYEGISVTIDLQASVFTRSETGESIKINVSVATIASHLLPQEVQVQVSMPFILYAWERDWDVGSWGSC